jgi:hypothetical protein
MISRLNPTTRLSLAIYVCVLAVYLAAAGSRLRGPSSDTHFSYLAKMWLERRLDLGHNPPNQNDWAEVEYLTLKDGRTIAGCFLRSQPARFRTLEGRVEVVQNDDIQSRFKKFYVSFPPFPAALFLPFVALFGLAFNDVLFTALLAPLGPMLLFLLLRRFAESGRSARTLSDDLWLTAMFAFGTVYFYSSVLGQVWYTAHIVSTVLACGFLHAALDARRPILAGLCLGALVLTRPQMGFFGIFYLYELWRITDGDKKKILLGLARIGLPVAAFGAVGAWFNWARFHSLTEFGHFYLNVRWTDRIQRYGLFNYAFLARNLAAAFTLTPKLLGKPPYVQIPWHGLSMLITTPALAYLLWPRDKPALSRVLWATAAPIALMSFLYQNDGWVQFGFRFSIDYLVLLFLLLAVGNRPITRTWKGLIVVGIVVNAFGAVTFGRMWQYYYDGFFPIGLSEL